MAAATCRRVPATGFAGLVGGPPAGELGADRALGASVALVAISDAQRRAAPDLPWAAAVDNAVAVEQSPTGPTRTTTCCSLAGGGDQLLDRSGRRLVAGERLG
jgi:hypothetical protein